MRKLAFILFIFFGFGASLSAQVNRDSIVWAHMVLGDYSTALSLIDSEIKGQTESSKESDYLFFQKGLVYERSLQIDSAHSCFEYAFLTSEKAKHSFVYFQSARKLFDRYFLKSDSVNAIKVVTSLQRMAILTNDSLQLLTSIFFSQKLQKASISLIKSRMELAESARRNGYFELQLEIKLVLAETAKQLNLFPLANRFYSDAIQLSDSLANIESQLHVRQSFLVMVQSVNDYRKSLRLRTELDSLQTIAENTIQSSRIIALSILRKSAADIHQKSISELQRIQKTEIQKMESTGFTRRLFLFLLVFIFLSFFIFYFFRSIRSRKEILTLSQKFKSFFEENLVLKSQISELLEASDDLIQHNEIGDKEKLRQKNEIKTLQNLLEQSKQDTSGLVRRLHELQEVYSRSSKPFQLVFPNSLFYPITRNGLNFHFFACSELRLLKPGKMFASKGDSELRGVGESSEVFILVGTAGNAHLHSALDNLWLQHAAIHTLSEKKNRSTELIRESFSQHIPKATSEQLKFSVVKLNCETKKLDVVYAGTDVWLMEKGSRKKLSQSAQGIDISEIDSIVIFTNEIDSQDVISSLLPLSSEDELLRYSQHQSIESGLWIKIRLNEFGNPS
jgi:hypothetical protein